MRAKVIVKPVRTQRRPINKVLTYLQGIRGKVLAFNTTASLNSPNIWTCQSRKISILEQRKLFCW